MTQSKTADVEDVLEQFNYVETIERTIGTLKVTLAEAHSRRNRAFGAMMFVYIAAAKAADKQVDEDQEIDCFCATLLKSWNLTEKGKPVAMGDEAAKFLKRNQSSRNLYRELSGLAASHALFKGKSKKKTSSKSTPKPSKSATSRRRSSRSAKSANGSLPKESNAM